MADMQPITSEQLEQAEASAGQGGAYISNRFRVDSSAQDVGPAANYTLAGICAIVAFILFAATLAILIQDWNFLKLA